MAAPKSKKQHKVWLARSSGWGSLEEYVERGIREARRKERAAREGYDFEDFGPQHWEGYSAALVNLRKKMKRTKEATPNRGSSATEGGT